MANYVGLDVSQKTTMLCVVDGEGHRLWRGECTSSPDQIVHGLGITGLADVMVMIGLTYGSADSLTMAADIMQHICHTAYRASIALAKEKGCFPYCERDRYLSGAFIRSLPDDIRSGIAETGIRNSHLLAIAPTGNDQPSGRQRVQRLGADLRRFIFPQRACRGWDAKGVHSHRLCTRSVAADVRRGNRNADRSCHRR